ncbi:MAG: hypothetical protein II194_09385 [Bacteroidales bacterium]|nr:hypothetical protein [Bacteroidales bacterium]
MKNILKYAFPCILMLVSSIARAQNTELLERMYDDFSSKFITLDISYVLEMSSTDLEGEGVVSFQDNAYRLSSDGLEVYCDGKDIWMLDHNSKEVIIESLTDDGNDFVRNPASLFLGLKDNFKVTDISEGGHIREPGVKDIVFTLVPEVECGMDECQIQIKKNGDLYHGSFLMSDGQIDIVRVLVRSVARAPQKDMSYFRPGQSFDSSWIVTDLR